MTVPSSKRRVARKLILASVSPRRKEILKAAGIDFDILPTSLPERQKKGESAREFVSRMATEKARAALALLRQPCALPILGADTVVVVGRQTLGKPASPQEARRMLRLLSGRQHKVLTGLCLLYPAPKPFPQRSQRDIPWTRDVQVASTTVKFCRLTREEIKQYVATGEPLDKAGAYAIQGRASKYVEWIRGCYFNVVGLPISLLYQMLKKAHQSRESLPRAKSRSKGAVRT
jgi:septum formation protein